MALVLAWPREPETFEYEEIARNLLSGRGYVLEHFGTEYRGYSSGLIYTLLTAAAHALGAPGVFLFVLQCLFAAGTTLAVWSIARRLGASVARATAAGLITALHPSLVYYDVFKRHPLGLDALLICGLVATVLAVRSPASAAVAGTVLGAAMLERLTLVPMLLVVPFWLGAGLGGHERRRRIAAFAVAALLPLTPWVVRNTRVFGRPLLSTMTSEYLFMGNVPPSLGSYHLPSGELTLSAAAPELRERLPQEDEQGQGRLFRAAFLDFVRREPARFAYGVARKLVYFWTWAPQTGVLYPAPYRAVYLGFYGLLLILAVAGAAHAARHSEESRRALWLIAILGLVLAALHAVLCFEMRHRWSLEPLLVALGATCALPGAAHGWRNAGIGRRSGGGALR